MIQALEFPIQLGDLQDVRLNACPEPSLHSNTLLSGRILVLADTMVHSNSSFSFPLNLHDFQGIRIYTLSATTPTPFSLKKQPLHAIFLLWVLVSRQTRLFCSYTYRECVYPRTYHSPPMDRRIHHPKVLDPWVLVLTQTQE